MSGVYINANRVYSATEDAIPNAGDSVQGGLFVGTFVSGVALMGLVVSESDLSTNAPWVLLCNCISHCQCSVVWREI